MDRRKQREWKWVGEEGKEGRGALTHGQGSGWTKQLQSVVGCTLIHYWELRVQKLFGIKPMQ